MQHNRSADQQSDPRICHSLTGQYDTYIAEIPIFVQASAAVQEGLCLKWLNNSEGRVSHDIGLS